MDANCKDFEVELLAEKEVKTRIPIRERLKLATSI